jgi:hypothetical protein
MKRVISLSFGYTLIITAFFLLACQENSISINKNATILGKWNVLNDSQFSGIGLNNHQVNYTGQTGDYFDFRSDHNVYIKEGTALDTLNYRLISDSTISISSFAYAVNETSDITTLTTHRATINAPVVVTPGGQFGRKVDLSR